MKSFIIWCTTAIIAFSGTLILIGVLERVLNTMKRNEAIKILVVIACTFLLGWLIGVETR